MQDRSCLSKAVCLARLYIVDMINIIIIIINTITIIDIIIIIVTSVITSCMDWYSALACILSQWQHVNSISLLTA